VSPPPVELTSFAVPLTLEPLPLNVVQSAEVNNPRFTEEEDGMLKV